MKNTKKIILRVVFIILLLLITLLPTIVRAGDSIFDAIKPTGKEEIDPTLTSTARTIITVVQFIGVAVAVVMIIVYGIRYFTAAPDKQADLKKAIWGYLIGAVCIFGAVAILQVLKNSFDSFQAKTMTTP